MDLAEFGLELGVDLVESAAESEELAASLLGDQQLRHPFPIDSLPGLEGNVGNLLPRSTHFSRRD